MTVTPAALSALSASDVDQAGSLLAQLLLEYAPAADLRRGVLGDLLLQLAAPVWVELADYTRRTLDQATLQGLVTAGGAADAALAAAVLSNYRQTASPGTSASGQVTVVVSAPLSLALPLGTAFAANGLLYGTSQDVQVVPSAAAAVAAGDVPCLPYGAGEYAFTVPVLAAAPGTASNLARGTAVLAQAAVPGLVSAFAATDLAGGTDAVNPATVAASCLAGLASAGFTSAAALTALLRQRQGLAGLLAVSVVGTGNPAQRRQHTLFPVALAGRADAYVRTQALTELVTLTKTATLVAVGSQGGLWQLSLGRADAPGFYEVVSVQTPTTTLVGFSQETPGFDLTGLARVPDIATAAEAAFSSYQTLTLQFIDPRTPTTGLVVGTATLTCTVTARVLPGVDLAQAACDDPETGSFGLDLVVHALVPCLVSIALTVQRPANEADPLTAQIQQDLAGLVNQLGFPGSLAAEPLQAAIGKRLTAAQRLTSLELTGRLLYPDGTVSFLRSTSLLTVPDDPARGVTADTVAFFLDPVDVLVTITVAAAAPPP